MNWLVERREELVAIWFDRVMDTYSAQASQLLKKQSDPFANPIGSTFRRDLAILFDFLTGSADELSFRRALDNICRIRSVQDFTPSQAIGFVFLLKQILHAESGKHKHDLSELDAAIDRLALQAFDMYQKCREDLAEVRINEAHRRTEALVRQLNRREQAEEV